TLAGDEAVVAILADGAGSAQQFCTGTLVAPRVVVTAAHCLTPNVAFGVSAMAVFFGDRLDAAGTTRRVTEVAAHPDWTAEGVPNDIGLIALDEDAPVPPIEMISADAPGEVGEPVRLIGFGITTSGATDNGIKREGTAEIERSMPSTIYLTAQPSLTCNGDSGGPLYLERGGRWVFAGIHSRSDCEVESLNERIDAHRESRVAPFIDRHGGGGLCMVDGVCDEDCVADRDCGFGVGEAVVGGCATAFSPQGWPCLVTVLLALGLLGRRRRWSAARPDQSGSIRRFRNSP